jgi:hypothetical protein
MFELYMELFIAVRVKPDFVRKKRNFLCYSHNLRPICFHFKQPYLDGYRCYNNVITCTTMAKRA